MKVLYRPQRSTLEDAMAEIQALQVKGQLTSLQKVEINLKKS